MSREPDKAERSEVDAARRERHRREAGNARNFVIVFGGLLVVLLAGTAPVRDWPRLLWPAGDPRVSGNLVGGLWLLLGCLGMGCGAWVYHRARGGGRD